MAAFTTDASTAHLDQVAGRRKCSYRNKFGFGDNRLLNSITGLSLARCGKANERFYII